VRLSERQQNIMSFLKMFGLDNGYPPTIRQIGAAVGITSTSVVNYNLNILQKAGYISRDPTVSRGIRLTGNAGRMPGMAEVISVPLLGRIAAGEPIPVPEEGFTGEAIELARSLVPRSKDIYALEVRGDSMIDAFINDGDVVVMQYQQTADKGDMVAAWLVDQEATTLKRYHPEGKRVRLQPENSQMKPIYVDAADLRIQGKVVAVFRKVD
jgi:repressor LexA